MRSGVVEFFLTCTDVNEVVFTHYLVPHIGDTVEPEPLEQILQTLAVTGGTTA